MKIQNDYSEIKNEIIAIRRHIHMHPELGFEEYETADTICAFLDKYGIEYTKGIAKTGICAYIGKDKPGKTILIRADMDALPFEEKTSLEFSSVNKGVMHACGHDIHIANALAVCYILKKNERELNGTVKVIFQPDEEGEGGALSMIKEGVLKNKDVDLCIGLHVSPSYETGTVYFKEGALMASPDDFSLEITGKSAHGAEPERGINPIEAISEFIVNIKSKLSEKISFCHNVFTICTVNSGSACNIIPDTARLTGTFRSFSEDDRKICEKTMESYAKEICEKYGTSYSLKYNYMFPPLINDAKECRRLMEYAEEILGKSKVKTFEKPLMTGEDFSYFAKEVPSVFVWAGCKKEGYECSLHSSNFIADENVIETAAALFAGYAIEYLK